MRSKLGTGKLDTEVTAAPAQADTEKAPAVSKKADKAALAEKQAEAKRIAGKVMSHLGKPKLSELLDESGASKFSDIKDIETLDALIVSANAMLNVKVEEPEDDNLLGDSPAAEVERTLEDIKGVMLQVYNHAELGRGETKCILAELGVRRLSELKADKFTKAYNIAEKALKNVG